ncbi:MAG: RHS repeat-associated core domain-containing protein, partial [Acidobacteriota bacterium]
GTTLLAQQAPETQSDARTIAAEALPPALPPPPVLPPPPAIPEGMIASNGNGSLTFGNYTYDPAGAITAIGGDTYRYDKVGRLVSGTALGGTKTQTFTYDTYGNLTSITKGTVTSPLSVDAATNHISSPATYDVAGNLTAYGVYGYSWDAGGMLSRTSNGTSLFRYVYTADDERIGMEEISTYGTSTLDRWTWSVRDLDGQVLRVFTSSGGAIGRDSWSWSEDYVYGPGGILATESAQGRRHFHLDHLGTPRMITDGGGFKLSRHDYYAFGEEASGVSQDAEVRKFTGHERDMLSGNVTSGDSFDYMHARYYAPLNGRFLSPDPIEGDPGSPQSWNRYTYVLDDPIVYVDPRGLKDRIPTPENPIQCGSTGDPCNIDVPEPAGFQEWLARARAEFEAARSSRAYLTLRQVTEGSLTVGASGYLVLPWWGVDASVGEVYHTGSGIDNFGVYGTLSALAAGLDAGMSAQVAWTTGPLSNVEGLTAGMAGGVGPLGIYLGGGNGKYTTVGISLSPPKSSSRYLPWGSGHVSVGSTKVITLGDFSRWISGQ